MLEKLKKRLYSIYSKDFFSFMHGYPTKFRRNYCYLKYKMKYPDLPHPSNIYMVSPDKINHTLGNRFLPNKRPKYGVLGGKWDLKKERFENTVFKGLFERFKEGKKWEDTIYFRKASKMIKNGEKFNPLSSNYENSLKGLKTYLGYLDQLFQDIKKKGYDKRFPIRVHVGREGSIMTKQGNHRTCMSKIIGIDEIPVKVTYWHKKFIKNKSPCFDLKK